MQPERLIVFDPLDQYGGRRGEDKWFARSVQIDGYADVLKLAGAINRAKSFRVRYVDSSGNRARFNFLCACAFKLGGLTLVVEELQLVVSAGGSGPGWADCTMRGRNEGLSVVGIAQRPASVDKNFLDMCSTVRTGCLNNEASRRTMAGLLDVDPDDIKRLAELEYIEREMRGNSQPVRGKVALPGR